MKTLLLILTLLVSGCSFDTPIPDSPFMVTEVIERYPNNQQNRAIRKYRIEINDKIYLDTDTLYSVGDTIK